MVGFWLTSDSLGGPGGGFRPWLRVFESLNTGALRQERQILGGSISDFRHSNRPFFGQNLAAKKTGAVQKFPVGSDSTFTHRKGLRIIRFLVLVCGDVLSQLPRTAFLLWCVVSTTTNGARVVVCCLNYNERRSCCGLLSQLQRTALVVVCCLKPEKALYSEIMKINPPGLALSLFFVVQIHKCLLVAIRGVEVGVVRVSHVVLFLILDAFKYVQKRPSISKRSTRSIQIAIQML